MIQLMWRNLFGLQPAGQPTRGNMYLDIYLDILIAFNYIIIYITNTKTDFIEDIF